MEELKNVNKDVNENVDREEKLLLKKRTHVVDGWIQSVEAMEKEVTDLLAKGDGEIQKKCFGTSCCPKNCRASYKIGKMVLRKMEDVALKKTEGSKFIVVAEPLPSPVVMERPFDKTVGLDSLFNHVCVQLEDEKVGIVGLYGMGGVGKTTLLTRINNEFLKTREDEFDAVIWVTVSRSAIVEKVQQVLLNKLGIPKDKWEGRSEDERKEEIFNVLKTKKFVLLLDDMWEALDLFAVGIPPLNNGNKSKVVFTTRLSTVCLDMGAKGIEVNSLEWEEAFALFQKYVGEDTINSHPDIPELAEIVAKECAGLPLALITIGRAMAGTKTPEEWERTIKMLKNYPAKFPGMENHLFSRLAFSYDSLQDEATKSCFLYCSIFPEDCEIHCNELVQLWIGEGFLDESDDLKKARDKGEAIIERLYHACLLEINYPSYDYKEGLTKCVKMHDVIRDMALWLACQNGNKKQKRFVVVDEGKSVTSQEVEEWKGTQKISLVSLTFEEHIESPSFPDLQTLLLGNRRRLFSLPSGFFSYMPNLTVLDLGNHFELDGLPMEISKLVTLQYLNLSNTGIRKIPMELRNLKKLRILILNNMGRLQRIPSQIISGLSSL